MSDDVGQHSVSSQVSNEVFTTTAGQQTSFEFPEVSKLNFGTSNLHGVNR